jgi:hypothetical protein
MALRYFCPATGTWSDDLVLASHVTAEKTGKPKCYAHPINGDPNCSACIAELEYLKRKKADSE